MSSNKLNDIVTIDDRDLESQGKKFGGFSSDKRFLISKPDLVGHAPARIKPLECANQHQVYNELRAGINSTYEPVSRRARGKLSPIESIT